MRRKNTSHQQDIDDLRKQNRVLEDQSECQMTSLCGENFASDALSYAIVPVVRQLEKGKSGYATSILEKPKNDSISSLDGISDSEAGTSDGDNADGRMFIADEEPAVKRAKTDTSDQRAVTSKQAAAVRA
jgi:hypothetical protein